MSFKRFVQLGRVVLVNYGEEEGKLATIVDVIDNNRVLVDGPAPITGVKRQAINLKRCQLTDIVIPAKLNASQKALVSLWKSEGVDEKWKGTTQFKKRNNRALRAAATDFDRFQVTLAKQERSKKRKAA